MVEYAPVAWIDSDTYKPVFNAGNMVYEIAFLTGDWLSMPYLPENVEWNENQATGEQGKNYTQEIVAVIPNMRVEVEPVLEQMSEHRFCVKYTDRNGKVWLIGTPNFGLEFSADGVGGSRGSGLNSYKIKFQGLTPRRAVGYEPTS